MHDAGACHREKSVNLCLNGIEEENMVPGSGRKKATHNGRQKSVKGDGFITKYGHPIPLPIKETDDMYCL